MSPRHRGVKVCPIGLDPRDMQIMEFMAEARRQIIEGPGLARLQVFEDEPVGMLGPEVDKEPTG